MKAEDHKVLVEACRLAVKSAAGPMARPAAVEATAAAVAGRLSAELVKSGLTIARIRPKGAIRERLARELFLAKHGMSYDDYVSGRSQEELDRIGALRILEELVAPVLVALENLGIEL